MPHFKRGERLEVESSRIHDKMLYHFKSLCNAVSALQSLEDHYDLREDSIEMIDNWCNDINSNLHQVCYSIDDLEVWAFDGDTLQEIVEDENYEDHKDKEEM